MNVGRAGSVVFERGVSMDSQFTTSWLLNAPSITVGSGSTTSLSLASSAAVQIGAGTTLDVSAVGAVTVAEPSIFVTFSPCFFKTLLSEYCDFG